MDEFIAVLYLLQGRISQFAGFGIGNSYSVASFCLVVILALIGGASLNHLAERRDSFHLTFNVTAMFAGGVIGNAVLRGLHMPFGNELVITVTLALFGMSAMALVLLLAYHRTDI